MHLPAPFEKLPLVVGVTGHRNVPQADEPQLRKRFGEILEQLQRVYPSTPLLVMSGLAAGSDTFAAEEALDRNIPVLAALPMAAEIYERDFTPVELARFKAVRARCWDTVVVASASTDPVERYVGAGRYIAYYGHILVAFWDGEPGSGPGGTAEVVFLRMTGAASPVSDSAMHYVPDVGPVYQIVTPREGRPRPERCFEIIRRHPQRFRGDRNGERDFGSALQRFDIYNHDLTQVPGGSGNDRLLALMNRTDAVANGLQKDSLTTLKRMYLAAGVAGVAQVIDAGFPGIALKLGLLVIAFLIFSRGHRRDFENRYQDYRAISEALRVQHAWCCAGLGDRLVEASYRRMQQSELQWIRLALRTSYLVFGGSEAVANASPAHAICQEWVRGQRAYYLKAGRREAAEKARWSRFVVVCTGVAIVLVFLGAAPLGLAYAHDKLSLMHFAFNTRWVHGHARLLSYLAGIPMAAAGTIALLVRFYGQQRGFSENIRRYQHMYVVFDFALRRMHRMLKNHADGQALAVLEELGREALAEHADWLVLHRERPLSFVHT